MRIIGKQMPLVICLRLNTTLRLSRAMLLHFLRLHLPHFVQEKNPILSPCILMPAISVPMGTVERESSTLPVGIHFTAPKGNETLLFKIGADVTGEQLY
jgi:hypothetical protein